MDSYREKVGQGAFGMVKKNTKGSVVKIVPNSMPYRPRTSSTIELTVAQMDNGPHVIQATNVEITKKETLIFYPQAKMDMHRLLRCEGIRDPRDFFTRIALGIAALHNNGIVHRDLKPSNILIFGDQEPRIGDFGTAYWYGHGTMNTCLTGTYNYIAPEIILGLQPTPKSDVWSFGVLLLEAYTGRRVFEPHSEDNSPDKILQMIQARTRSGVDHRGVRSLDSFLRSYKLPLEVKALVLSIFQGVEERPTIFELLKNPYFQGKRPRELSLQEIKEKHSPLILYEQWWYVKSSKRTTCIVDIHSICTAFDLTGGIFLIAVDLLDQWMVEEWAEVMEVYVYIAVITAASYYGLFMEEKGIPEEYFKSFAEITKYKSIPSPFLPPEEAAKPYHHFKRNLMAFTILGEYYTRDNLTRLEKYQRMLYLLQKKERKY